MLKIWSGKNSSNKDKLLSIINQEEKLFQDQETSVSSLIAINGILTMQTKTGRRE